MDRVVTDLTKLSRPAGHPLYVEDFLRASRRAELENKVQALLRRGERKVVLDLGRVSTIDAAGIGELVHAYNMTIAAHGVFRIVNTTGQVRELLERARLFDLLSVGWDSRGETT